MALTVGTNSYISVADADIYFADRINAAWDAATADQKAKALVTACDAIEHLNFVGEFAVEGQTLQFPRDNDTVAPAAIKYAQCEEADSLLDGRDLNLELENLRMISQGTGPTRATYSPGNMPVWLFAGLTASKAWRYLIPFLRDLHEIHLSRVS